MTHDYFVHVLLFQCPRCDEPIAAVKKAPYRSLEEIDASEVELLCKCLWVGRELGIGARRHLVCDWPGTVNSTQNSAAACSSGSGQVS